MAAFLDITDFTGIWNIPYNTYTDEQLVNIIERTQETYLTDLLGAALYQEFIKELAENPHAEKWDWLKTGKRLLVTIDSISYEIPFKGCKELLKYFTYYEWQKEINTTLSLLGQIQSSVENSNRTTPMYKASEIYNKGVELYGYDWAFEFIDNNSLLSYDQNHYIKLYDKILPSAYNFIYWHNQSYTDTFDNWIFKNKNYTNFLNI